jgi:hypothetical protein
MEGSPRKDGHGRETLVGGLILVGLGTLLLIGQFVPDVGRYVALVIGLGLLALFVVKRDYGLLVGGGIVTGVGVGILGATMFEGTAAGAAFMICLGLGFLGVLALSYLMRLPERHWWPAIPGLILTGIGLALAVGGMALELVNYWPVVLIVLGVILVGAWFLGSSRRQSE